MILFVNLWAWKTRIIFKISGMWNGNLEQKGELKSKNWIDKSGQSRGFGPLLRNCSRKGGNWESKPLSIPSNTHIIINLNRRSKYKNKAWFKTENEDPTITSKKYFNIFTILPTKVTVNHLIYSSYDIILYIFLFNFRNGLKWPFPWKLYYSKILKGPFICFKRHSLRFLKPLRCRYVLLEALYI